MSRFRLTHSDFSTKYKQMKILSGKKVSLRALELDDLSVLYEWENQQGNWFAGVNLTPFSRFYLEQYIISAQNDIYADRQLRLIIEDTNKQQVGIIDLFDFEAHHRRASVGIIIAEPFRHHGYASEALDIIIRYCREILSLHQLHCTIEHDNPHSLTLFQKKGFRITGIREQWSLRGKEWTDEHFLQLFL